MPIAHHGHVDVYYETFGDPADPTLLLVNGLGSQSINYADDWCRMFAAHGLHVVRYDNRDVGLSSHLPGETYTMVDMAGDGIAVLDALGVERAHLHGLSMGGLLVQTMAIHFPERVLTMTSVMSSTGEPEYGTATKEAIEAMMATYEHTREGYVEYLNSGLRVWGTQEFADEARWRALAEAAYDRSFDPEGVDRQLKAVRSGPSRAEGLRNLEVPTLVIHGDRDTLLSDSGGRRTAELVPGAKFVLIEGMGHDYPPQLWRRWTDLVVGHIAAHDARVRP